MSASPPFAIGTLPLPDQSQLAFCSSEAENVRLLAPAGSGKTLSLLWRCKTLFETAEGTKPRFLLITFTRAARDELLDRLVSHSEFSAVRTNIEITTLNSWGWKRVRETARNPRLITKNQERYSCVQNTLQPVWRRHESIDRLLTQQRSVGPKAVMRLIDFLKDLGISHKQCTSLAEFNARISALDEHGLGNRVDSFLTDIQELQLIPQTPERSRALNQAFETFIPFWRESCVQLFETGSFTLEDQKYWAWLILQERIAAGKEPFGQSRYTHVFIDEFQDINALDLELLKAIANSHRSKVTVVGDDDQALFEWRGATPNYILSPEKFFGAPFTTFTLNRNYRSPSNIVFHSQELIRHNTARVAKDVSPAVSRLATIALTEVDNLTAGMAYVRPLVERSLRENRSIALVARKRSQIIPYQVLFAGVDIPFCAAEDLHLFLSEAFESLKYLLYIKTRAETVRPPFEVVEDIIKLCDKINRYPLSKIDRDRVRTHLTRARPNTVLDGLSFLSEYKGSLKGENSSGERSNQMLQAIFPFVGAKTVASAIQSLGDAFSGLQKDYGKAEEDIFYTDPPFAYLTEYAGRYDRDFIRFIGDLEKAISTLVITPPDDEEPTEDSLWKRPVHLMTALRAKGKEFDRVVLLDVNDGIWPSRLATSDAQKQSERRVFYVAMTRAREELHLVVCKSILGQVTVPSPYIAEAKLSQ